MSEQTEALALVTATFRGVRHVLLIEPGDGADWAMPGGAIGPREIAEWSAARALHGQAGLPFTVWTADNTTLDEPRRMPDPDGAVTVVARCDLGEVDALPEVRGGDDARRAEWIAVEGLWQFMNLIFPAHRGILSRLR